MIMSMSRSTSSLLDAIHLFSMGGVECGINTWVSQTTPCCVRFVLFAVNANQPLSPPPSLLPSISSAFFLSLVEINTLVQFLPLNTFVGWIENQIIDDESIWWRKKDGGPLFHLNATSLHFNLTESQGLSRNRFQGLQIVPPAKATFFPVYLMQVHDIVSLH